MCKSSYKQENNVTAARFGGEILNFDVSMHNAYLEIGKEDTELSGRGSQGYTHHGIATVKLTLY